MLGLQLLAVLTALLIVLGCVEGYLHRRNLRRVPIRVHVNGTRGKSSVTRLIAAALRENGRSVVAKTTGTLARVILPNAVEVPIFRPAGASVMEQKRVVALAAAYQADVLVVECMALQPELQALCEFKMIRATHGVITNARPDHLEVMGPSDRDVALALCGMVPVRGKLYTAEREQLEILRSAAKDRASELVVCDSEAVAAVQDAELLQFNYVEHRENVALALLVCAELGLDRALSLRGMQRTAPDPGAMTVHDLDFFGRQLRFVNAFAANDPVSTEALWNACCREATQYPQRIALVNCRADRVERSLQLGRALPSWEPAHRVVLIGTGTEVFAKAATNAGLDSTSLVFAEGLRADEIFEQVVNLVHAPALVVGLGNIAGCGLDLARYFSNRGVPQVRKTYLNPQPAA